MKNVNFVPKYAQRILSSYKIFEKYKIKKFTIFTGKHLCWSLFFNENAGLKLATLVKRDSNTGVFLTILRNF